VVCRGLVIPAANACLISCPPYQILVLQKRIVQGSGARSTEAWHFDCSRSSN